MAKKKKKSLDERIDDIKKQQQEVKDFFIELQGAIKILEQIKNENDETTD